MVRLPGRPRRTVLSSRRAPPPLTPRPPPAPAEGPSPPLRGVGRRDRPNVRHRPVHGPGARALGPQPRPRRPRPRQAPGHLRDHLQDPRRADQDRRLRPRARRHSSRGRGCAAAAGGRGGAGRGGAGEQRRGGQAMRAVPARGGRGGVGEDDAGELVGSDGGDRRGAAGDGAAGQGRRRQHRVRVVGGHPFLPPLHHLRRFQTVRCSVLPEPLRRVQKQRDRCAMPGPAVGADQDDVGGRGIRQAAARPAAAAARADVGRVRARGGALDRARPAVHAQPGPPAPVVPLPRRAGPAPRRAAPA